MNLRTTLTFLYLASLLVLPDVAHGHAFPDHSNPRVGAEPAFSRITVQDVTVKKVDQGNGRVNPSNSVLLEVGQPPLPPDTYRVIWNVVARDGHRTNGHYTFTIK